MFKKVALGVLVLVVFFLGYVASRDGQFNYETSGVINAPPEKIFPYISDLQKGSEWSPYEKDSTMTKKFGGTDGSVGSTMDFESKESGSGHLEILEIVPNRRVKLRLLMTSPFRADNLVTYELTPEAIGTRFSWSMSGDGGFMGKLIATLIDCRAMVIPQFDEGIQKLKTIVEDPSAK